MAERDTAVESLKGYLRQLAPPTRAKLLAEIERLRQNGDELPGAELIIAELRDDPPPPEARPEERPLDPVARQFFAALEPYLSDHPPDRTLAGRIARRAQFGIWEWISRDLMASMARDFTRDMKQYLINGRNREAELSVRTFQNKAVKYLEGTIASTSGAEQARNRLSGLTGSKTGFNELRQILRVLKAREPLAQFAESLPQKIDKLVDERLETIEKSLSAVTAASPDAMPFGLTLVLRRLVTPWQLIRFATKSVETKDADDVAESPYGIAVNMVLDHLDDLVATLRVALRDGRIVRAKEILVGVYDLEYSLRVRIDLFESEWGDRLDRTMELIAKVLDTEARNVPEGLNHVLHSRGLRQHQSMMGQITRIGYKCRDALNDGVMYGRNLVAGFRK